MATRIEFHVCLFAASPPLPSPYHLVVFSLWTLYIPCLLAPAKEEGKLVGVSSALNLGPMVIESWSQHPRDFPEQL